MSTLVKTRNGVIPTAGTRQFDVLRALVRADNKSGHFVTAKGAGLNSDREFKDDISRLRRKGWAFERRDSDKKGLAYRLEGGTGIGLLDTMNTMAKNAK